MVVNSDTNIEEYIAKVYAFDELMSDDTLRDRLERALDQAVATRTWEMSA